MDIYQLGENHKLYCGDNSAYLGKLEKDSIDLGNIIGKIYTAEEIEKAKAMVAQITFCVPKDVYI